MVRILQLLAEEADFQTRRGIEALARDAGPGFDVVVRTVGRGGSSRGAAGEVGRLWREPPGRGTIIHAWGLGALTIAAMGGRGPIVFSPTRFLGAQSVRWLRAVIGCRDVHIVCPTATLRRFCIEHGIPLERCHLIRPGVEFARVQRRRNPALRRQLGFSEQDHVVLVPGESTRAAAHEHAVWTIAIAHFLDPRCKLLMWGRGARAAAAARRADRLSGTSLLGLAEPMLRRPVEFEELLPAADSVLITARAPVATTGGIGAHLRTPGTAPAELHLADTAYRRSSR